MKLLSEHSELELVENPHGSGCGPCAFLTDVFACVSHACSTDCLPSEHPLKNSPHSLVWLRKAA